MSALVLAISTSLLLLSLMERDHSPSYYCSKISLSIAPLIYGEWVLQLWVQTISTECTHGEPTQGS